MSLLRTATFSGLLAPLQARLFALAAASSKRSSCRQMFPQFESLKEVLAYADTHVDQMDSQTLHSFLSTVDLHLQKKKNLKKAREYKEADAFCHMLDLAVRYVSRDNAELAAHQIQTILSVSRRAVARRAARNSSLSNSVKGLAEYLSNAVLSQSLPIDASSMHAVLRTVIYWCKVNSELREFVLQKLPSLIPKLHVSQCSSILLSLHDLEIRNPNLICPLLERMKSDVDQLNSGDVVFSLKVFAQTKFASYALEKRVTELILQHAISLNQEELIQVANATITLGTFKHISQTVITELQKKSESLNEDDAVATLRILEFAYMKGNAEFAYELVASVSKSLQPIYSLKQEIIIAHSICLYELSACRYFLSTMVEKFIKIDQWNSNLLPGVIEILLSCQLELNMEIKIPAAIEKDFRNMVPYDDFDIEELTSLMPSLPKTHKFRLKSGIDVGPFKPALVDESNKDNSHNKFPNSLRDRLYKKLGYIATSVCSRNLRLQNSEEQKIAYLILCLDNLALPLQRISKEEFKARREASPLL